MSTSVSDFRIRFPEFTESDYPDARVQLFIDDAICDIGSDEARWCGACKYNRALCYYTAHLLSVGTASEAGSTSANAGPISGKTAGGVSVQRATVAKDRTDGDDWLMTTTYGQQFIMIRNTCFVGVLVACQ